MHYERLQIADTSFNTHEQLNIFQQPDSQLSMNNLHYSQWKNTTKYTEKAFKQEHRFRQLERFHS